MGIARASKYGNRRTAYGGGVYDSKLEAEYARTLDLQQLAGVIAGWRRGREWVLLYAPKARDRIVFRPDFEVWGTFPSGEPYFHVKDTKGVLTPVFRLKAKLFKAKYPDVPLFVVLRDGSEVRM